MASKLPFEIPEELRPLGEPIATFRANAVSERWLRLLHLLVVSALLIEALLGVFLFLERSKPMGLPAAPPPVYMIVFGGGLLTLCALIGLSAYDTWLRKRRALVFRDALVLLHGSRYEVFRWEDVADFRQKVTQVFANGRFVGLQYDYTVVSRDGRQARLTEAYRNVDELGKLINMRLAARGLADGGTEPAP